MNKPKHTPGPWEILRSVYRPDKKFAELHVGRPPFQGCDHTVARVPEIDGDAVSNARLIAAAPEMLSILKEILDSDMAQREQDEGRRSLILDAANSIVAKAEGKS